MLIIEGVDLGYEVHAFLTRRDEDEQDGVLLALLERRLGNPRRLH